MKKAIFTSIIGLASLTAASATTLALDFQATGGTTAAGYQAFEFTTQTTFPRSNTYTEFGSSIIVTVNGANLENTPADWRSITRNGDLTDVRNDWIGVDARSATNAEAQFIVTVSGLPAGLYTWRSTLHDGGTGARNAGQGNINGAVRTTFVDSTGTVNGVGSISAENPLGDAGDADMQPTSFFTTNFTSDGSPVSLTLGTTGNVASGDAIFALTSALEITSIPEPSTGLLGMLGLLALLRRRR